MRFSDLRPQFVRREIHVIKGVYVDRDGSREERNDPVEVYGHADAPAEAHGVTYLCPKCFAANGGPVGTHSILSWFAGRVPDDVQPGPGRWVPVGTGYADLSLRGVGHGVAGATEQARSVWLQGGCGAHFFVTDGEVTFS